MKFYKKINQTSVYYPAKVVVAVVVVVLKKVALFVELSTGISNPSVIAPTAAIPRPNPNDIPIRIAEAMIITVVISVRPPAGVVEIGFIGGERAYGFMIL